jgi:alkylhydroperoxidase family enzyme
MPEGMREALGNRPPLNIFRALANAPTAAPGFLAFGAALLTQGELDAKLRELVIIRVGLLSQAGYEVHQHRQIARRVGLPQDKVDALDDGPEAAVFDPLERDVLRFTDAVVKEVKAPDGLYAAVAAALSDRELCELVLVIGFYMLVSRFLENLEVEIEDQDVFGGR